MYPRFVAGLAVTAPGFATSCDDPSAEPDVPLVPTLSVGGTAAWPTPANIVLSDEAELVAAAN